MKSRQKKKVPLGGDGNGWRGELRARQVGYSRHSSFLSNLSRRDTGNLSACGVRFRMCHDRVCVLVHIIHTAQTGGSGADGGREVLLRRRPKR